MEADVCEIVRAFRFKFDLLPLDFKLFEHFIKGYPVCTKVSSGAVTAKVPANCDVYWFVLKTLMAVWYSGREPYQSSMFKVLKSYNCPELEGFDKGWREYAIELLRRLCRGERKCRNCNYLGGRMLSVFF